MKTLFNITKTLLGPNLTKSIRPLGHGVKGILAANKYNNPANKLKVIGITGTKGKTTTTVFLGRLLNLAGIKAGYLSTSVINSSGDRDQETLNPYKMTTIDAFAMHKYLNEMIKNQCEYVVLEMSSEGLAQNRHWGLNGFDITLFLNIYPEHLESHGSFDNYLNAKGKLFEQLNKNGLFIGNGDENMKDKSEKMWMKVSKFYKKTCQKILIRKGVDYDVIEDHNSIFKMIKIGNRLFHTNLLAEFEVFNLYYALKVVELINNKNYQILLTKHGLESIGGVPGRMEFVIANNKILS
jgi:UDP-N-acetylmuramoyl-L-alanyl-D-glutamate--2,6-diaminopimelate ligase